MPVICEKVPQSELVQKAAYEGVQDFVLVGRDTRPKDVQVAKNWSMEPCFLPKFYEELAEKIDNFQVRPDDVWLLGFPKSGTTWSQELVWLICNNLDYAGAKVEVRERFPVLEVGSLLARDWKMTDVLPRMETSTSPRFIKSHLPCHLLPLQMWTVRPKMVYVARNVKDIAISCYHHYVNVQHYSGSFEDFMDAMLNKKMFYAPYHSHVKDFYGMRHEENILFLTYEDMKKDLPTVIRRVVQFFGKNYTEDQIQDLAEHLSFASCSKNSSMNLVATLKNRETIVKRKMKDPAFNFVRRGQSGSYRDEMTSELVDKFDRWTEREIENLGCSADLKKIFYYNEQ